MTFTEEEHATVVASLVIAALQYADPSGQIALLRRLGIPDAERLVTEGRERLAQRRRVAA